MMQQMLQLSEHSDHSFHDSPIGVLTATWTNQALQSLCLSVPEPPQPVPSIVSNSGIKHIENLDTQLQEYASGTRTTFSVPYVLSGTPFQRAVWQAVAEIPYGSVTTYRDLARAVGRPSAVRAVGTAVGRNPIAVLIPCHRVVGSHSLGGYAYGLTLKKKLLLLEGVELYTSHNE